MDQEDAELSRLAFMLRWRAVRALARWNGSRSPHKIDDLVRRMLARTSETPRQPGAGATSL